MSSLNEKAIVAPSSEVDTAAYVGTVRSETAALTRESDHADHGIAAKCENALTLAAYRRPRS